jgi:hypothetical protein
MDQRAEAAQRLFWEIEALRRLGVPHKAIVPRLAEMAELHEARGRELLDGVDPDGWIDLLAAITAWGEAGYHNRAYSLLQWAKEASAHFEGTASLLEEIRNMEKWLAELPVLPTLAEFAQATPAFDLEAA